MLQQNSTLNSKLTSQTERLNVKLQFLILAVCPRCILKVLAALTGQTAKSATSITQSHPHISEENVSLALQIDPEKKRWLLSGQGEKMLKCH